VYCSPLLFGTRLSFAVVIALRSIGEPERETHCAVVYCLNLRVCVCVCVCVVTRVFLIGAVISVLFRGLGHRRGLRQSLFLVNFPRDLQAYFRFISHVSTQGVKRVSS